MGDGRGLATGVDGGADTTGVDGGVRKEEWRHTYTTEFL